MRKPAPRVTVLDPAKAWIDAVLWEDTTAPRRRKDTARGICQRLAQEYGFDPASYPTVCDHASTSWPAECTCRPQPTWKGINSVDVRAGQVARSTA